MQWVKRGGALLLAVLMLLCAVGCKKKEEEQPVEQQWTVYEGEEPVDMNGYEFTVIDFWDIHWNREKVGTPYADTWIKVLDEVEGLYNCKITPTYLSAGEIFNHVQPELAAGEKAYDLICTTQWGIGYFIGGGYLMDLNELNVDWDAPYWNQNIREGTTVNGKTYAGGGPFIFDSQSTWMMYYNGTIWSELGLPDPYQLVRDGKWTIDLFTEYATLAKRDQDGDGVVSSAEDRWGLVTAEGDFIRSMILGMEGNYFTTEEDGHVVLACNNDYTFSIVDKLKNMMAISGSFFNQQGVHESERIERFVNSHALFYAYMPGVEELKDMDDDWGALPLPKFDEAQKEYLTGIDQNAFVFGVTSTNRNTEEVGTLLTALGLHAQILEEIYWPDYKETYWRHEEQDTAIMRDYVVGHGRYDIALMLRNCETAFWAPVTNVERAVLNRGSDFASAIETVADAVQVRIDDFFKY